MTLKQIITTVIFMSTTLLSQAQKTPSITTPKGVKNVVLVHGAFADGSSWSKVIPLLQAKGLNVIAVQNPLISFEEDVAATKRAIAQMNGPVLLAGHSYGGMVISEAGKDPKVAGLLYVAALIPEEGQHVNDVNAAMPPTAVGPEILLNNGFLSLSPKAVNEFFAQDATPAERKIIYVVQTPWAVSATQQKVYSPAWQTKPSWSVIAANDGMINPDLQRFKSKLIKAHSIELSSGHVPMVTMPQKVAAFILDAAAKL